LRVVLDANVLVSGVLSRSGTPARLVQLWIAGAFELVVSDLLLAEVERALAYPKVSRRVSATDAADFITLLRRFAVLVPDPEQAPSVRSVDPKDDYLLALAARERVPLVSGDADLIGLGPRLPILTPRQFLEQLEGR
jgi:putative PIN family toxin of toxin-antitoxin system